MRKSKMMRTVVAIIAAIVMAFGLAACGAASGLVQHVVDDALEAAEEESGSTPVGASNTDTNGGGDTSATGEQQATEDFDASQYEVGRDIGQLAPDFTLELRGGGTVTLSELRGRPVLLNFCTTWCPPCQVEFPEIQAVYEKYGDRIHVLGVSSGEPISDVDAYFGADPSLTYPMAYDPDDTTYDAYQIDFIPQTWILDANGVIVNYMDGRTDEAWFTEALDAAF